MVTEPHTIEADEPFSRVWYMFRAYGIRHLPVIDNKRLLKGIITTRDFYRIVSPRKTTDGNFVYDKDELDNFILERVMTKDVASLSPDDRLGGAMALMINQKYGCVPIVDKASRLLGIVTHIDILKYISKYFT